MNIYNIGTDLIEVKRIERIIGKYPSFLKKIYTDSEINYCRQKGKVSYECFASRFAAKEAAAKSLGQGIGRNVFFKEIEIRNNMDGKPFIAFSGMTLSYANRLNIKEVKLTISSTSGYCIAFAISLSE